MKIVLIAYGFAVGCMVGYVVGYFVRCILAWRFNKYVIDELRKILAILRMGFKNPQWVESVLNKYLQKIKKKAGYEDGQN